MAKYEGDATELWETVAEDLEALSEFHPEVRLTDFWGELVRLGLINQEHECEATE